MTKEPEIGTLAELNVRPGDVAEFERREGEWCSHRISHIKDGVYYSADDGESLGNARPWRIVSRASQPDTPKLWRDMTDREGWRVCTYDDWQCLDLSKYEAKEVVGVDLFIYRIRPEPVRETVRGSYWHVDDCHCLSGAMVADATHSITFDLIDGEPDLTSIRMEKL